MSKLQPILRVMVWIVCVYHLLLGLLLNCPPEIIRSIATTLLGATRMPDESTLFLARMLGTYLMAFGLAMGLAAWNPVKNRAILTIGAILVLFRGFQRIFTAHDLQTMLGITSTCHRFTFALFIVFALALVALRWQIYSEMKSKAAQNEHV